MKSFIKRSMAALLVAVMLLSAAPLNGFVDLLDMFDFSIEASAASEDIQTAIFPLRKISVTQKAGGSYSHKGTKNVDFGLSLKAYAPFDCKVVEKSTSYEAGNRIIVQSLNKVLFADGTVDYMTLLVCHDEDISDLYVGKTLKQGEYFYKSGKYGNATGVHIHMCVAKGKYAGQYKNTYGKWELKNSVLPSNAFYISNDTEVINSGGYTWKKFNKATVTLEQASTTNTTATIKAKFNVSVTADHAYIISTKKDDVNVDATKEANRKNTSTREFVTVKKSYTSKEYSADILNYKGAKLQPNKTYYYKILVKVSGNWYQSAVGSFKTTNLLPDTPDITFVTGKTDYSVSDAVAVSWKSTKNTDSYKVTVYNSSSQVIFTKSGITSNSFSFEPNAKELPAAGDYYFTVSAVNAVGTKESAKKKFTLHSDKTVEFFDPLTNKVLKTEKVPYGHAATPPKMSSVKGYTFIKWDGAYTTVKSDVRVTAVFEPHEYTVTFVDDNNKIISKEIVKYGKSATLPEKNPEKTGYKFVAWSVKSGEGNSYTAVNGNVTFEPTFAWSNPTVPLAVKVTKALRTSDSKGYTVYSTITNGTSSAVNAKLIAVIKTSNGKTVATKMDIITVPASASGYAVTTNVGGTAIGTVAEVYIVANDKNDDNKTGGAYAEMASVRVTRESTTSNKYWGSWSSWSTSQPTASSTREVASKKQYSYRDKETSTANSKTKDGWTLVSSTPSSSTSWGSWSSWSTTKQTEVKTDGLVTKQVETRTVYKYQHYCNGSGGIAPTSGYTNSKYGPHVIYSTTKWTNDRKASVKDSNGNYYYICDGHTKCEKGCGSYYYMGTTTQYRYRTRSPIYSFYRWTSWSSWSDTVYTASSTREVKTQTVYRYRDLYTSTETVSETYIGEEDTSGKSYTVSGNLTNIKEDYSGKIATVMVYKEKNTDPTESQIEYVGQIKLGSGNSYSITFIPREEISMATGDYIVSLGIATADGLVNYVEVIEAPKPDYKVTFYDFDGITPLETVTVKEGGTAIASADTVAALTVPEGHKFTTWDQSTVNVRADLAVLPQSEVQKFAVVFIDWESQKFILEEYEYGDEISVPEATQKEGYNVSWDMSMAKEIAPETAVAEGDEEINSDANAAKYTVVRHTVISTVYEKIEYNSSFISPESEIAKKENGLTEDFDVASDGDSAEIVIDPEDIILEEENTFDEYIETPMDIEETEEYIFLGWKNIMTGEYLTDMRPENDAIYVPMYEFAETAEDPVADIVTGEYIEAQTVTLTSATESAVIYYTLDGTDPKTSETAVMYTGPITVSSSSVLMACAMAVNMNSSSTVMELYAINTGSVTPYHIVTIYSDLPIGEGIVHQSLVKDFVRFDTAPLENIEGYTLSGLYYDEDFTEEFDTQNEPVYESMDVYAHYIPKQYTVTFLSENGEVLSTQSVEYGSAAEAPQAPAKDGYVFIGWDSDGYDCVTADGTYKAQYIPESEYAYVSIKGRATRSAYVDTELKLTIEVTPDELANVPVSWTTSDPSVATVDYMGNVTFVGIGTVYVTVTVDSNGESDTVEIRVREDNTIKVVLGPQSYMMVDELGYLRGLKVAVNTVEEVRSHFTNDELSFFNYEGVELDITDKVGTGTIVCLMDGDDVIDQKTFIMTGDVNGDGWYDGQDATIVSCLAEGMLTIDDVGEAVFIAADCNYDGVIDQKDVELLNKAGALISNVDQKQPVEELEENEDFVAYASLIDQSGDIVIDIDGDNDQDNSEIVVPDEDPDTDVENGENAEDDSTQTDDTNNSAEWSIFTIFEFIKSVFTFLLSLFLG